MYSQFNFPQEFFKVTSYYSNTATTDSNIVFSWNLLNRKPYDSYIQFTNVFSSKFYATGKNKSCTANGVLPSKFTFPNVYETACQVAISCSETFKYVPLCKQVLAHDAESSEIKFKDSFNAYLEHYHLNQ